VPRHHGPRAQAKPLAITQPCAWPGCTADVQSSALMCKQDWVRLPTHLRNAWVDGNRSGSAGAVERARSAIAAYASRNRVSEEAGTSR
jgi:hypothetical protein